MKKTFLIIITVFFTFVFVLGCSSSEDISVPVTAEVGNFPESSRMYGMAVADEIRGIVANLNKMGANYADADLSEEFKTKFYADVLAASPSLSGTKFSVQDIQFSQEAFARNVVSLTEVQIVFVGHIIEEIEKSGSYDDFAKRIFRINQNIYANVPKLEQERLFNVTAVLYYGATEIHRLESLGEMIQTPNNKIGVPRLKSGSEEGGGGGFGSQCRKFLATGWAIAVGEPTPLGEIVMSVVTVYYAGSMLYEVITCPKQGTNENLCGHYFGLCMADIRNSRALCAGCLAICIPTGQWICPGEW